MSKGTSTKTGHETLAQRSVAMPQNGTRNFSPPCAPYNAPQGGPVPEKGRGTQTHKQYNRGQGVYNGK